MSKCSYVEYTGSRGSRLAAVPVPSLRARDPAWALGSWPPAALRRERSERREHLVVIRLVTGIVEHLPVPHHAILVDHEHGALRDSLEADHVLVENAVLANDLLVEVAQQRKRQLLVVVKRLQREERVDAD